MSGRLRGGLLLVPAVAVLIAELSGFRTAAHVKLGGDVARESRWLAQYGQLVCLLVSAALIWQLDPRRRRAVALLLITVFTTAVVAFAIKHLTGRVRPGAESVQSFTGPFFRIDSKRESFPSSHTAAAFAFAFVLSQLYPQGRWIFWSLAIACGALRWIDEAHWLSDVLAGAALGYFVGWLCWRIWAPRIAGHSRRRTAQLIAADES